MKYRMTVRQNGEIVTQKIILATPSINGNCLTVIFHESVTVLSGQELIIEPIFTEAKSADTDN